MRAERSACVRRCRRRERDRRTAQSCGQARTWCSRRGRTRNGCTICRRRTPSGSWCATSAAGGAGRRTRAIGSTRLAIGTAPARRVESGSPWHAGCGDAERAGALLYEPGGRLDAGRAAGQGDLRRLCDQHGGEDGLPAIATKGMAEEAAEPGARLRAASLLEQLDKLLELKVAPRAAMIGEAAPG